MQARSRAARKAGLVTGLLLLFFVMLTYQVNAARTLSTARGAVLGVVSPVHRAASAAVLGVTSLWRGYIGLVGTAARNTELHAEVSDLRRRLREIEETRHENDRLRALLGLDPPSTETARPARVIGRDLAHRYQALTLDRGSADGIVLDSPVLSPQGSLVGRVVQVARWTSIVQLITDPLSGIGARLAESRATGLVDGNDGPELELRYITSMTRIRLQEPVVTSGEDGLYPAAIRVGTVASFTVGPPVPGTPRVPLAREETALFLEVRVRPDVDVLRLETVLIIAPLAGRGASTRDLLPPPGTP